MMRIINPFNILMYAIIWLYTAYYLRQLPNVSGSRVGWIESDQWLCVYSPMTGKLILILDDVPEVFAPKDMLAWFYTPKAYRICLHDAVGQFLAAKYGIPKDDHSDSD